MKVPHLFAATGATTFGRDHRQYPWTIAYQPTYIAEGAMYGNYIRRTSPTAKIAILYQDDSYGADLIKGLERGLGPRKGNIVAKQGYKTDDNVQSQVARLRSSNAKILMLFTTPKFTIQAYQYVNGLGWKPKIFVNAVSSASNVMILSSSRNQNKRVEGSISIVFLSDPNDPKWAKDPGVLLYWKIMKRFARAGTEGRLQHVRHVGGVHVRRRAEARREEPDASVADERGAAAERAEQPVPAAEHVDPDLGDRPLSDRPGSPPALAEGPLDLLRRLLKARS